jgi:membrane protein
MEPLMFPVTSFRVIVRAFGQWSRNQDTKLGAALAYYTLFSIAPLLVFAIRVASVAFDPELVREYIQAQVTATTDEATAKSVEDAVDKLMKHGRAPEGGTVATIVSLSLLVFGALGMFLHVRTSLCTIWKLEPPHGNTFLGLLVDYSLALLMVFIVGLLLLGSLAISTALPFVVDFVEEQAPEVQFPWRLAEMGISLFLLMLLFAVIYRVLSGRRIPWRYVWYGSLIASLLFTLGKTGMGLYLAYFSPASVYGAAGSVMVFLLWVYYSSLILFFGAELIQARRTRKEWLPGGAPATSGELRT